MHSEPRTLATPTAAAAAFRARHLVGWLLGVAAIFAYPLVFPTDFPRHLGIMVLLYAAMGQAWNILGGYAGQISFGQALFFGIGAYTSAMLQIKAGVTPLLGMWVGAVLAMAAGLAVGPILFRLSGHYFVIATLAMAEIAHTLTGRWEFIGANAGLTLRILPPSLVNYQWESKLPYYFAALALATLAHLTCQGLQVTRPGYYFRAIKASHPGARAVGVAVERYKSLALAVSAALTALCGSFYAHYLLYVDPGSVFGFKLSVMIALMVVLGGAGAFWGPLLGALVLVPLSEYTRIWFSGSGRAVDLLVYGALLMVIALYQPWGIWGMVEQWRRRERR